MKKAPASSVRRAQPPPRRAPALGGCTDTACDRRAQVMQKLAADIARYKEQQAAHRAKPLDLRQVEALETIARELQLIREKPGR